MEKDKPKINIETEADNVQNDISHGLTAEQTPIIKVTPANSNFISKKCSIFQKKLKMI